MIGFWSFANDNFKRVDMFPITGSRRKPADRFLDPILQTGSDLWTSTRVATVKN